MEFEISKQEFGESLKLTQGVVERRNTLPILSNVLLEPIEGGISVFATDLDVGVRQTCTTEVKGSGAITVNARKLYEIVKDAPGDRIRVRGLDGHAVEISSGKVRFRLVGLDPKEYPSVPGLSAKPGKGATAIDVDRALLDAMIEATLFAVSLDETRLNLSGVYVEGQEGTLRMVATDGHRLAMIDRAVAGKLPDKGVILPRKGLSEAKKILETPGSESLSFTIDGSIARILRGRVEIFMRLIDGEFPDYRQVVPKKGKVSLSLGRDEFLAALRRVSILSTERAKGVRVTIENDLLEVQTNNPDLGEAAEEIEIRYGGEKVQIGFNARYLVDALLVMKDGERVEFVVTDDVSPGVLRPEGDESFCYVVMPMRL